MRAEIARHFNIHTKASRIGVYTSTYHQELVSTLEGQGANWILEQARELVEGILAEDTFLVDLVADDQGTAGDNAKPRRVGRVAVPSRYSTEFDKNPDAVVDKVWTLKQLAANVYGNLAASAQRKGIFPLAKEGHMRSLNIRQEIGDQETMTTDLRNLGKIAHLEGDLDSACSRWGRCVEIFRDLERRDADRPSARTWTKAIEDMLEGMRESGCNVEPFVAHSSDAKKQ